MKHTLDSKEIAINRENVYYWMNKYIALLEKYNELLIQQAQRETEEHEKRDAKQNSPGN